jgi:hypothetical protein
LNIAFFEVIAAGKQASPLFVFVTRVEAVGGAAGAVVGAGVVEEVGEVGLDVLGGAGAPSLELLLDPQPLRAETKNINVSGANAANALDPYTISTPFLKLVIHPEREQQ